MAKSKYKTVSCHNSKTAAKTAQAKLHKEGKTAQIVKGKGGKYCIKSKGKRKVGVIKKTGQRISGKKTSRKRAY